MVASRHSVALGVEGIVDHGFHFIIQTNEPCLLPQNKSGFPRG